MIRAAPVVGLVLVLSAGCGAADAPAPSSAHDRQLGPFGPGGAGCGRVEPITESTAYTAYSSRHDYGGGLSITPGPVTDEQLHTGLVPPSLDGLPAASSHVENDDYFEIFYGDGDVNHLMEHGGISLQVMKVDAATYPETAPPEIAARVTYVELGSHLAQLTWADPDQDGTRPHVLVWHVGDLGYRLDAVRSPEETVALGRTLVCE